MQESMRSISPFGLRMPPDLRQWIEEEAEKNRRSMNSEIVWRLEELRRQEEEQAAKAQKQ